MAIYNQNDHQSILKMADPLISICIPSYERVEFLQRLLDSISMQTFKNFEVIFTDDSKTEQVKNFVENYKAGFPLFYHKNTIPLGTARNMVEGRAYARSQWIKIIHDDDFFASENAIQQYANACTNGSSKFIFSGYNAYYENTGKKINKTISIKKFNRLSKTPSLFFANNYIGPPSVLMFHTSINEIFDTNLRWFTDMEYYFRIIAKEKVVYIEQPLINVSYNDSQVTNFTRTNPAVVIPESLYIINKHGEKVTSNIIAYDSWWRVYRNIGISTPEGIAQYANNNPIPKVVKKILNLQNIIPEKLIKIGFISKTLMFVSYLINKI